MEISTIGIDLSKTTFHLIGLSPRGEILLRKKLSRKAASDLHRNRLADADWDGGPARELITLPVP